MGSTRVTALTEQRGNRTTNPEGISPEISNPIEQVGARKTGTASSKPLLQKFSAVTADGGIAGPLSKPVLQRKNLSFPSLGVTGTDDTLIEQRRSATIDIAQQEAYDGPIEQFSKTSSSNRLQQVELKRSTSATGTPLEQVANVTNTVNVEQFDLIELIFPPCGSIKNPVNTNILWRIRDFGFPFDVETLIFRVEGIEVQDRSSFSVTDLGTGLELSYDPTDDFPFNAEIELGLEISDTAVPPNEFFVRCSWSTVPDTRPPIIANVSPCDQGSNVSVTAPVTFDVYDTGLGVDPDSIQLSIEGVTVCSGLSFDAQIFPGSGTGYHVEWEHSEVPFKFGSNVTVSITAGDLANPQNSALFICDFDTELSSPPTFQNFDPAPCESFVDTRTGLTFEVYGNLHGVDITTLEVRVDNKLRRVIVEPRILRSQ